MRLKFAALACALVGTCNVFAAAPLEPLSPTGAGESEFFSELPVVLSVTRLQHNMKDVPGFVTVIDAEMIRHSGARDLAELLRGVPGFQVAFNPYGAPVATYHGLGSTVSKGLQVLVDGRTQYSTLTEGGVSWNLIDVSLADIERIEVLRGSNSPTYGSNSFMGVVNVVTRHAASTRGALINVRNGNEGVEDYLARIGFGAGIWNARLTAETRRDQGEPLLFDDRRTERFNLRFDADLPDGNSLKIHAGMLKLELGTGYPPGSSAIDQEINQRRDVEADSKFAHLNWRRHNAQYGDTEMRVFRVQQELRDFFPIRVTDPRFPGVALSTNFNNSGEASRNDIEVQHTLGLDDFRLVGGVGWRKDEATHINFYGPGRQVEQTIQRLFGEVEWRPNAYVTTNVAATAEDDTLSGSSVAPRAALNVHLTPAQTVKIIAGKSRRLPTLYESKADERLFETVGTVVPGLGPVPVGTLLNIGASSRGQARPEEVTSHEVGYLGDFKALGLGLDARWFEEKLKNRIQPYQITQPPVPPCPVFELLQGFCTFDDYVNTIDARIRGWESQLDWTPTPSTRARLTHARVKIDAQWISPLAVDTEAVPYVSKSAPRNTTSVAVQQRLFDRLTLSGAYYWVDGFKWTRNTQVDSYHRFDWRLAYDFRIAAAKAEVAWTVRNDGQDRSEWASRNGQNVLIKNDVIGTRQFLSFRLEL